MGCCPKPHRKVLPLHSPLTLLYRDSDVKLAKLSTKELRQREAVSGNMKTNVLTRQLTKSEYKTVIHKTLCFRILLD